jgi:hypothetical protein
MVAPDGSYATVVAMVVMKSAFLTGDAEPWLVYQQRYADGIRSYVSSGSFALKDKHVSLGVNHGDEIKSPVELRLEAEALIAECEQYRANRKYPDNHPWKTAPVGPQQLGRAIHLLVNIFRSAQRRGDGSDKTANQYIFGKQKREFDPLDLVSRITGIPYKRDLMVATLEDAITYEQLFRIWDSIGEVDYFSSERGVQQLVLNSEETSKLDVDMDLTMPTPYLIRESLRRTIGRRHAAQIGPPDGSKVRAKYHHLDATAITTLWQQVFDDLRPKFLYAERATDAWKQRFLSEFTTLRGLVADRMKHESAPRRYRIFVRDYPELCDYPSVEFSTLFFPEMLKFFRGDDQRDRVLYDEIVATARKYEPEEAAKTPLVSVDFISVDTIIQALHWPSFQVEGTMTNKSGFAEAFAQRFASEHPRLRQSDPRESTKQVLVTAEHRIATDPKSALQYAIVYDHRELQHFFKEEDLVLLNTVLQHRLSEVRSAMQRHYRKLDKPVNGKSSSVIIQYAKAADKLLNAIAVLDRGNTQWAPTFLPWLRLLYRVETGELHYMRLEPRETDLPMGAFGPGGLYYVPTPVTWTGHVPEIPEFDVELISQHDAAGNGLLEQRTAGNNLADVFGNGALFIEPTRLAQSRLVFGVSDLKELHSTMVLTRPNRPTHHRFINPWHADRMIQGLWILSRMPLKTQHGAFTESVKSWFRDMVSRIPAYVATVAKDLDPELQAALSGLHFATEADEMERFFHDYPNAKDLLTKWVPTFLLSDLIGEKLAVASRKFKFWSTGHEVIGAGTIELEGRLQEIDVFFREAFERWILNPDQIEITQIAPEL